ncbi:hypothetical protein FPV67DRAFT_1036233 [Lyophyllum atratum]|nr:hypothetical protein FPV67DRAFT_1036233 [Lyophyllum atratum]
MIGITSVVCTVPAIATTGYRLWIRRGRYWADDAWALCSAISQLLMFSGSFVHITNSSPKRAMVSAYYLMAAPFYCVVWFARLSILFSLIRIDPSAGRRRRLLVVAVFFFLITVVLVCQLFWVCEPVPSWKDENSPQCLLPRQVVVLQLVTDILSDAILIIAPLRLLRNLSDKKLRRRLTVIFSTCLITTVVSLVHAAFIFVHAGHKEVIAAIVEDCVSLIVCNVPVVVTSLLHIQRDHQKANASTGHGPSRIRFATWNPRSTAAVGETTTAGTTGWMNNFRWERELESEESETTDTALHHLDIKNPSVEVQLPDTSKEPAPNNESEFDVTIDDSRKKASWQFHDG